MTRAAVAEFLGSAFLLIAVVGSGIMAERLSGGNVGLALLANALATGFALYALITVFAPLSGAHFNPIVSVYMTATRQLPSARLPVYIVAQIAGAVAGVIVTHAMFDLPLVQVSGTIRAGVGQWVAEVVATFGLLLVILGGINAARLQLPALVGAWIAGAYWFTASTSFANPAVTLARALTDTFAGIAPGSVPGFLIAQLAGLAIALLVLPSLFRN